MITDEQYKALQNRVDELENRMASMSRQFSSLLMRRDVAERPTIQKESQSKKKDITKYLFEGKTLCKRGLVLEGVKKYVKDNKIDNSKDLLIAFPDYIQGSLGVVKSVNEAERYSDAIHRFYFRDNDVIKLSDTSMVICSQWDIRNISRFIKLLEEYGYSIEVIERKY